MSSHLPTRSDTQSLGRLESRAHGRQVYGLRRRGGQQVATIARHQNGVSVLAGPCRAEFSMILWSASHTPSGT